MNIETGGILGLIVLILDVWAIVKTLESGVTTGKKVLWIVIILIFPLVGVIAWWFLGPRKR